MTEDQELVHGALSKRLGLLEGPSPRRPYWYEFSARKRDAFIQRVLRESGLPELTESGRVRYYTAIGQGIEDAGGYWSRRWCEALGMSYLDPFSTEIHPRSSTAIVHEETLRKAAA